MRTRLLMAAAWMLVSAAVAGAQTSSTRPAPTDPVDVKRSALGGKPYASIDFGGRFNSVDGDEARYQRYRDLTPGIYATNGLFGRRGADWTLEAQAWNIGYRDQKVEVNYNYVGRLETNFVYDQIPLFFSRDTRSLYSETTPGVLRIDDFIQQSVQSGSATLRDFQDVATRFDARVTRYVTQMDLVFNANRQTDLYFNVRSAKRSGVQPYGATFGFSNAVEVAAPIDTRTSDFQSAIEWANKRGLVRVGWDGSWYNNDVQTLIWDNPLRYAPDAPGNSTQGRLALWPDNTLNYVHGQAAVNFPYSGRLSGYVAIGQGKSNADLLPRTRTLTPMQILDTVGGFYNLTSQALLGPERTKEIAMARQVAMYLIREETDASLPAVGELLGGRDHTTIMYGYKKVADMIERDDNLRRQLISLRERLYSQVGAPT